MHSVKNTPSFLQPDSIMQCERSRWTHVRESDQQRIISYIVARTRTTGRSVLVLLVASVQRDREAEREGKDVIGSVFVLVRERFSELLGDLEQTDH